MTPYDSKSYLIYLNKLVDQYNNVYHHSINKKPINDDYSALTKKIETNPKAPKFKVNYRAKYKNTFSKGYTVFNTEISEVENKIPDHAKYITSQ